jgi:hypothetical protein
MVTWWSASRAEKLLQKKAYSSHGSIVSLTLFGWLAIIGIAPFASTVSLPYTPGIEKQKKEPMLV